MTALSLPLDEGPAPKGAAAGLRVLALDCATATGWATNSLAGAAVESGTQSFEMRRGESQGMRHIRFRRWLQDMLTTLRPEVVVYEAPIGRSHLGASAAEMAYAFVSRVQEEAEAAGLDYRGVNPSVLKWFATGKGACGKELVKDFAARTFPHYDRTRDGRVNEGGNEADALAMLAWALAGFPEREPAKKARKKAKV